ncbi:PD-(D/E)XK nuclease family transposase [Fibrobacter sp. UWB16]|uniref:PD-(D/E)XK nuclease family transposase n=1 Tax=Fibrobacter sp. UWB16 TaxID=1945874 RepID=UPI000BC600DD|nr:PD-(D/E)XK nuclease family transposase [Fibrobacter sp. UWB16]SOD14167.1 PD-(D/E)XK nuclease family transposase [Fibrobacter sp. UWB16]
MTGNCKKKRKASRRKARQLAILKKVAELKKRMFFDPTYDPVFKKIFEKMQNLIHFLNAVLHLEGEHKFVYAEHLKPTINVMTPAKNRKIVRFDIHARTMDGQYIDVEMQRASHENFLGRIELYSSLLTINAKIVMDSEMTKKERMAHPFLMPYVYSIWICNFEVDFCKSYHEELALFRCSDMENSAPLPIYPQKRYIVIDLTKYAPQTEHSAENEWIELFKDMPTATRMPKGKSEVIEKVYELMKVGNSTGEFIKKVATSMIDRDEFNACVSTARHEGEAKAKEKFAAREKKIAEYLRSHGVSAKLLNAALAIK